MTTLVEDLDLLHAQYVAAINHAIDADDYAAAGELAEAYDEDAVRLMAEREGKTDLLPLTRRTTAVDSRLRRFVARLGRCYAA